MFLLSDMLLDSGLLCMGQRLANTRAPLHALLLVCAAINAAQNRCRCQQSLVRGQSCVCFRSWYSCTAMDKLIDHTVIDSVTGAHHATCVVCCEPHWPYIGICGLPCQAVNTGAGQSGSGSGSGPVRASGFQRSAANRAKQDPQVQLPCHRMRHQQG